MKVFKAFGERQGKNYGTRFGLQQFVYFILNCITVVTLITDKYVGIYLYTHTCILCIIISSICYKSKLQCST
jgi:hypothetical protein